MARERKCDEEDGTGHRGARGVRWGQLGVGTAHADSKPVECGPYPTGWMCDETDYLRLLARDNIPASDTASAASVDYRVCRDYIGASDRDVPNYIEKKQQATQMVAASGVFAAKDAYQAVTYAVMELC